MKKALKRPCRTESVQPWVVQRGGLPWFTEPPHCKVITYRQPLPVSSSYIGCSDASSMLNSPVTIRFASKPGGSTPCAACAIPMQGSKAAAAHMIPELDKVMGCCMSCTTMPTWQNIAGLASQPLGALPGSRASPCHIKAMGCHNSPQVMSRMLQAAWWPPHTHE